MNINIYSDYEFLIDTKGQTFELDPTKHLYIENCPGELTLRAYPLNQTKLSIPFAFSLKLSGNDIKCEASNVKVYRLKNRCDVFISPFVLPSVICIYSQTHTIKNVRYTVCAYEDRIKISSSRGEYVFEGKQVEIGADDSYDPLCGKCYLEKVLLPYSEDFQKIYKKVRGLN